MTSCGWVGLWVVTFLVPAAGSLLLWLWLIRAAVTQQSVPLQKPPGGPQELTLSEVSKLSGPLSSVMSHLHLSEQWAAHWLAILPHALRLPLQKGIKVQVQPPRMSRLTSALSPCPLRLPVGTGQTWHRYTGSNLQSSNRVSSNLRARGREHVAMGELQALNKPSWASSWDWCVRKPPHSHEDLTSISL